MIKFRTWRKSDKILLPVRDIIWHRNEISRVVVLKGNLLLTNVFENVILMQSTGLFDDTGQEIFEGDVVKRNSLAPGGVDCVGVVKILEGAWVIDTGNVALSLWTEIDENEVIGNIHENPDLLEVSS